MSKTLKNTSLVRNALNQSAAILPIKAEFTLAYDLMKCIFRRNISQVAENDN